MSRSFDKLVALLKELFQVDRPDLDFGFYRIMHAKSAEVTQFLERDLLPQVQAALSQYQSADKAAIERELDETIRRIRSDGADPDTSSKVRDLRARLAEEAVDPDALEAEVYDHLYGFFRRYPDCCINSRNMYVKRRRSVLRERLAHEGLPRVTRLTMLGSVPLGRYSRGHAEQAPQDRGSRRRSGRRPVMRHRPRTSS